MASSRRSASGTGPRVLKKYPNRRLYDTQTSSYITLADVKRMVLDGEEFEVRDAKSGDDLTRSILLQIILEEETGGAPLFTTQMLAQVIRFYGNAMQGLMGTLLEKNLQAFVEMQNRLAEQSKGLYDVNKMTPDMWTRFISGQDVLDQSRKLLAQMQEQMQKQAETMFPGFPGTKK
jgi:polyhydroxyalkanoate synthesis repressor PhaR